MPTDETVRNIEAIIRSKAKIKGDARYIPRPCSARVVSDDDDEEDGVKMMNTLVRAKRFEIRELDGGHALNFLLMLVWK